MHNYRLTLKSEKEKKRGGGGGEGGGSFSDFQACGFLSANL